MGRVILCEGKRSKEPYYFQSSGIGIYTFEELCYYVCRYVETIGEELLSPELARFVGENLGMKECADKLVRLVEGRAGVRDASTAILGSAFYYDDKEISKVLSDYDFINNMSDLQRKKLNADRSLAAGRNREAMHIYRDILFNTENGAIDSVEYGNILHNMAIIHTRSGAFATAADEFREAYARNADERTLKQYIYALKLGHFDDEFNREIAALSENNRRLLDIVENELYDATDSEENTYDYHEFRKIKELREKGKVAEYYKMADEMVTHLKNKYRSENA